MNSVNKTRPMPAQLVTIIFKLIILISFIIPESACTQNTKVPVKSTSLIKHSGLWTIEWSPDDKYFALGGDDSILWIYQASGASVYKSYPMKHMVRGIAWHPQSKLLAVSTMREIHILNMETGNFTEFPGARYGARGIGWNHNGELLAIGDGVGIIHIWNKDGKLFQSIPKENKDSYLSIHWHPSKNIIAAVGTEIWVFDTSGKQLAQIKHRKENSGVLTVRWHPSGEFFATGDNGPDEIESIIQFWKEDGELIRTLHGSKGEYRNIRWNNDGRFLASASDGLRIWTKDGQLLHAGKTKDILWGIAWNMSGNRIITGSFDGDIQLWTDKATPLKSDQ